MKLTKTLFLFIVFISSIPTSLAQKNDPLALIFRDSLNLAEIKSVLKDEEPIRFMAKFNALGFSRLLSFNFDYAYNFYPTYFPFDIGLEYRLASRTSINLSLFGTASIFDYFDLPHKTLAIGPRFYKKTNKSETNQSLTGWYIHPKFIVDWQSDNYQEPSFRLRKLASTNLYATLNFGFQQRIFRRGYFDIQLGAGGGRGTKIALNKYNLFEMTRQRKLFFEYQLHYGWYLSGKSKNKVISYCELAHCTSEKKQWFKIDLYNLIPVLSVDNVLFNPSIAYERKLGRPFSIQVENSLYFGRTYRQMQYNYSISGVSFALEPRWYWLQKKIGETKTKVTNFNGLFLGLKGANTMVIGTSGDGGKTKSTYPYHIYTPTLSVAFGYQTRLFRHGFLEYRMGVTRSFYSNSIIQQNMRYNLWSAQTNGSDYFPLSELKIGLAF